LGKPVIAGGAAAMASGSAATNSAQSTEAVSAATGKAAESGATSRASGGARTAAASLGSREYANGDGAGGGDGTVSASGAAQGTQPLGQAQINLAIAEGSDATGATASALQSANAAATSPPATVQAPVMAGVATAAAGDGSAASVAATAISAAVLSASGSAGLAGDGSSHERGDANDSGAGLGGNGAAALQQLGAAPASSSSDSTPAATLRVSAPVDSADFPQGVADRVSFAVDNNWTSTKLQVNPPQLGPIDLQIAVQGDHAQVMMSTHSAVTREALESSLPRLKEMLNSQGFTQVSVDISQRSFQDRSAFSQPYTWAKSGPGTSSAAAVAPVTAPSAAAPRSVGALDAYA